MTNAFNTPNELAGSGDIRVIGDRACGKTTYLAALAYWPNHDSALSPIQSITPFDADTGGLCDMAENILKKGGHLPPSDNPDDPDSMPLYTLLIDLKPKFSLFNQQNIRIQVSCREYGGELIEDLGKTITSKLESYLNDCASASGLLIQIDGRSQAKDEQYAKAFKTLETELSDRLKKNNQNPNNQKIAIVFTKGEQAPIWNERNKLPDYINRKFPQTRIALQSWMTKWGCSMDYFICSAFGVMGNPPRPNVTGGNNGVIARPQYWKPFGLVTPLYWLYAGKYDSRLNDIP